MRKRLKIGPYIVAIVIAFFLYLLFSGDDGLIQIYRSTQQYRKNRRKLEQLITQLDSLTNEARLLKTDTSYIEKIAREKYGMAKPNETIYKFIEKKKN